MQRIGKNARITRRLCPERKKPPPATRPQLLQSVEHVPSVPYFFFLWRFLRRRFLRLWVEIFLRLRLRPEGIGRGQVFD